MRLVNLSSPAFRRILMLAGAVLMAPAAVAQDHGVDSGALLQKYCITCHNTTDWSGSLDLEGADAATIAEDPDVGEKVIKRLRTGMMPPGARNRRSMKKPSRKARHALEQSIDSGPPRSPPTATAGSAPAEPHETRPRIRDLLAVKRQTRPVSAVADSSHGSTPWRARHTSPRDGGVSSAGAI